MNWNEIKLKRFLEIFGIKQRDLADRIGVSRDVIAHLINGRMKFKGYEEKLNAYVDAQKEAKRKEHECMIRFYENFK
jgi:DNA transposition AAA+ family ATPase